MGPVQAVEYGLIRGNAKNLTCPDMPACVFRKEFACPAGRTGVAWLSSARVVDTLLSPATFYPRFQLPAGNAGDSGKTNPC